MRAQQFRVHVVRPTLQHLALWSPAAEILVLGTALHESAGLTFLDQITGPGDVTLGPAFGLYQIEPKTHDDLFEHTLAFHTGRREALMQLAGAWPSRHLQLVTNLGYATAVARLLFWRAKPPLPAADDLEGLAVYWKTFFNTAAGKGTVDEWLLHYRTFGG